MKEVKDTINTIFYSIYDANGIQAPGPPPAPIITVISSREKLRIGSVTLHKDFFFDLSGHRELPEKNPEISS